MSQIIKFRIYPESKHGFYFNVSIYPTKALMHKGVRAKRGMRYGEMNFEGMVNGFRKGYYNDKGRAVFSKTLGNIYLHRDGLGMEVVTHECTHAALRWADEKKIKLQTPDGSGKATDAEEGFCYALGRLARQISQKCWDLGLYK